MFNLCHNDDHAFPHVTANTPDVVFIDEESRDVTILEVSCAFDSNLDNAFMSKVLKYEPLREVIVQLGYKCKIIVFIFGSLGNVHRLVIRGLQMAGLTSPKQKF